MFNSKILNPESQYLASELNESQFAYKDRARSSND